MSDLTVHKHSEQTVDRILAASPEAWTAFWLVVETLQGQGTVFPPEVQMLLAKRQAARQRCKTGLCNPAEAIVPAGGD